MSKIVILGAGIAGHTAATLLRKKLPKNHEVVVISPKPDWNWVPSNIWVGVGVMEKKKVLYPLAPIYERMGITFRLGKAVAIHPEGSAGLAQAYVDYEPDGHPGESLRESYDYLVNATGPKLNFGATPGLGPSGFSQSVCTAEHAEKAAEAFLESAARLKNGEKQTFAVGTGHGTCTCQGAAFEYVFNVEHQLRRMGVRDKARIVFVTNEPELGDFGMGGLFIRRGGYVTPSRIFAESLFAERGIEWIKGAHGGALTKGALQYETVAGAQGGLEFDFAMLLPPFKGIEIKAFDRAGAEITGNVFAPSGFMKVDADYTPKPYDEWAPKDWPATYVSPAYDNVFAAGIAFAPPHAVSRPMKTPSGLPVAPAVPRTGMTAGIMGRTVAYSIADKVRLGSEAPLRRAPFATMGAACVASAGKGFFRGSAATITLYPLVPDYEKYEFGRDLDATTGEIGLAGHWLKALLHHMFIYKANCRPFWSLIPE